MMSYPNKYAALLNELRTRGPEDNQHLNSRVLVVDGLNTFIRSYSASPVTNSDGEHVGGISGTLLSIGHAIKTINPTRVIIVFDGKDGSAKRRKLYPEYKANRKFKVRLNRSEEVDKQDNQLQQLLRLVTYLEVLPFTTILADGSEADDVIAYVASDYLKDSQVFIMSSDKDFYQLVSEKVHVWSPTKKKYYYVEDVYDEFGIHPSNFAIYRAILGDKSDNITGVSGIGDKTIHKHFPILTQKNTVTVEDVISYAEQQPAHIKTYQQLLNQKEILVRNIQLMQLNESNLNLSAKMKIIDTLEGKKTKCNKLAVHRMLIEDRMTATIKNIDLWLREVTQKLDMFILQD